jgi:DNA-binding MurR/RpiR family transcriptional regulator
MEVEERLAATAQTLTTAERRIADVVLADPASIGFGTVAQLAAAADAGAATVLRLCVKLGYDGFVDLQNSVRTDLAGRLRPAVERIRDAGADPDSMRSRHRAVAVANVASTLDAVDAAALESTATLLADVERVVLVMSGAALLGVAGQFAADLGQLREGVETLGGNDVEVLRRLAVASPTAALVVIDLRRYDRWLLDALDVARGRGMPIVAVTDSVISPLAVEATAVFVVTVDSVGPFENHTGTLALLDLVVAEVAARRRDHATDRLDAMEALWSEQDVLGS